MEDTVATYVLVTGASKGLGKAIAKRLIKEGQPVLLHASRSESLSEFLSELRSEERPPILCADFSDPESIRGFCKTLRKDYRGKLKAVVNNAGITIDKPLVYQPERDIDKILTVNLKAPIMIAKTALKMFLQTGQGTIINMSSIIGETGNACQSIYAATKAGLVGLSRSLAQETRQISSESQIRVLSVAPGFIETQMTAHLSDEIKDEYLRRIPMGRMGGSEEIAALISFLLSDQAAYINGSTININGGIL